ncbi:hypothetical protein ACIBEH_06165 [Nocardia salmonicida]|uniref:hypothetical protein n=1 Tax=Nocardia salmonicida TaxID=53431 RepID=UPI0037908865
MTTQRTPQRQARARTARRATERANRKVGDRAERRGRRVLPTVEGFERALEERGPDGVAEALLSRHNQRMVRIVEVGVMSQQIALPLLSAYMPLSFIAEQLGAHQLRPPIRSGATWPDHLAWGLDSVGAAVRLMLGMQPIGAAIIARTQLERWSANLAFNVNQSQAPGEDTVAWLNRLWSGCGVWFPTHNKQVGDLFAELSELLHARGPLMSLTWLDAVDIGDTPSSEHVRLMETTSRALTVTLGHLRLCLATAVEDAGAVDLAESVASIPLVTPAESWVPHLGPIVWPMVPRHFDDPKIQSNISEMEVYYRKVADSMDAGRDPDVPRQGWPLYSLGHHRFRALTLAAAGSQREREIVGENPGYSIEDAMVSADLAGEMAAMSAEWLRTDPARKPVADALAMCSSALRSAVWLWLEDDSRAMACLRCVIEQIARARAWRVKPNRAAKIESNPNATPRDWIEAAGWRRLSLFNRALGEFAHGATTADWEVPRQALVSIQHDADTNEHADLTGRSHAIRASIFIVGRECAAWVDSFGSPLGEAYRHIINLDDIEADQSIEALMNRAWEKRSTPVR